MPKKLTIPQQSIKDFVEHERQRIDKGLTSDEAFEYVASQQILTSYDLDDDEVARGIVGGGSDGGFDAIYVFINEALVNGEDPDALVVPTRASVEIHFIQAKNTVACPEAILQNWKTSFPNLISSETADEQRYNARLVENFRLIESLLIKTVVSHLKVQITFWVASLVEEVHPNLPKQAEELKRIVSNKVPGSGVSVEIEFVTASRLIEFMDQSPVFIANLAGDREPLCLDSRSAIIAVSLTELNRFITNENGSLNKTLFEANIRDYQGNIEVNRSIRKTLEEQAEVDFWWLNNGLTIVADSLTRDMGNCVTLVNPRIVNGLQTSYEIKRYCEGHAGQADNRRVLVKCIASDDPEIRSQIIAATNKQSSIPPAFLRSLGTIHLQIERYYRNHGLHYDRRKNSCKNEGVHPKDIISVPFLGQCLISTLLQQPDYARARPSQILSDDEKYNKIFNDTISLDAYLALGSLAIFIREWFKNTSFTSAEQNDIFFYILFAICAKQADHFDIAGTDLENTVIPSNDDIEEIANLVYNVYSSLGGNPACAKSRAMVEALKEKIAIEDSKE